MNLGSLIVLGKLLTDVAGLVSPGPAPQEVRERLVENPQNVTLKPVCGLGYYAQKLPSGLWSCLVIPKGR